MMKLIRFVLSLFFFALVSTSLHAQGTTCDPHADYDCLLEKVSDVVGEWANAWAEHDLERYFSVYQASMSPLEQYDYESWRSNREARVSTPKEIKLSITVLEVKPLSSAHIGVRFVQRYVSENYSDNTIKQLILNANFKIVKERVVSKMSGAEAEEIINWARTNNR